MPKITLIKILATLFLLSRVLSSYAQTEPSENLYSIAWTSEGQLWIAGLANDPIQLEAAGACCAVFTADAAHLAYILEDGEAARLAVRDAPYDPNAAPLIIDDFGDVILANLRWDGLNHIWLNSVAKPSRPDAMILADELALWRLDLETGSAEFFHENAVAYPAPDGRYAILQPGLYEDENQPARLSLYDADGVQIGGFAYPAVSSGSHLSWLPEIGWTDEGLLIAIPPPDLAYQIENYAPTRLYAYSPQVGQQFLGEASLRFPAEVLWSPDGTYAAYIAWDAEQNQALIVRELASGAEQTILNELAGFGGLIAWDRQYLIFNAGDERVGLWSAERESTLWFEGVWDISRTAQGGYAVVTERNREIIIYDAVGNALRRLENEGHFISLLATGIR